MVSGGDGDDTITCPKPLQQPKRKGHTITWWRWQRQSTLLVTAVGTTKAIATITDYREDDNTTLTYASAAEFISDNKVVDSTSSLMTDQTLHR